MAGENERAVGTTLREPEIERRHPCEIPAGYPTQEQHMRKRLFVFTLSLMSFIAMSAPALADGMWGG